jgi:hypothetical protein
MRNKVFGKRQVLLPAAYGSDAEMLCDFELKVAAAKDPQRIEEIRHAYKAVSACAAMVGDITLAEEAAEVAFYERVVSERLLTLADMEATADYRFSSGYPPLDPAAFDETELYV